jgi:hypothetical protein
MCRAIGAQREVASLNACFESYEVPPENGKQPEPSILTKAAIHTVASDRGSKGSSMSIVSGQSGARWGRMIGACLNSKPQSLTVIMPLALADGLRE